MTKFTLDDLDAIIAARAKSEDETSYTRKLVNKGVAKCAQKLGEEAVEAAIAAVRNSVYFIINPLVGLKIRFLYWFIRMGFSYPSRWGGFFFDFVEFIFIKPAR